MNPSTSRTVAAEPAGADGVQRRSGPWRTSVQALRGPFVDGELRTPAVVGLVGSVVAVVAGALVRPGGSPTLTAVA